MTELKDNGMEIKRLDREEYDYYVLEYRYSSREYYKVSVNQSKEQMSVTFSREKLQETRFFENADTLFQDYWNAPEAYAVFDGTEKPVAFLELDFEEWNSRVRITQLLVDENKRRKGYGKALVDFAKRVALERDYRIVVLETQSNNVNAIDFYFSQGFRFCGSNIYFYSNDDIGENEVMLEIAYLL